MGKLLDGTECQVLLDTGASKSFRSKSHYLQCKTLHSLPQFASKTQRIQVGNGQCVSILFIISVIIDIANNGPETIIFKVEEMLGVLDLRSLGYYKIKHGILQQYLSKYYKFEKVNTLCECFNKFINTLKKERDQEETKEKYPWLDPSNERKYMRYREILEKYIDLDKSCLMDKEKWWQCCTNIKEHLV